MTQSTADTSNPIHESRCASKRDVFDSAQEARKMARRMAPKKGGRLLLPYRCPWCGRVHLTTKRP